MTLIHLKKEGFTVVEIILHGPTNLINLANSIFPGAPMEEIVMIPQGFRWKIDGTPLTVFGWSVLKKNPSGHGCVGGR
jgi:hypothetical protein